MRLNAKAELRTPLTEHWQTPRCGRPLTYRLLQLVDIFGLPSVLLTEGTILDLCVDIME